MTLTEARSPRVSRLAAGAKDGDGADGVHVRHGFGGEFDDQVEGAFAFQHLGGGLAADGGGDDGLHVGDGQAIARNGRAVNGDLDLRLAQQQVGADIRRAGHLLRCW